MRRILSIVLSLTMIFTFAFAVPTFAGTAKLKTVKITKTDYDIKDGVLMKWKGVKGAQKYYVVKNGEKIKTIKATKKNKAYTFREEAGTYNGDLYCVAAVKKVKQKQYYNKNTKKWQTKKPAKKYIGKTRYKKLAKVFATSTTQPIKYNSGENGGGTGEAINIEYYTDRESNITGYKGFKLGDVQYSDITNNEGAVIDLDYWKAFVAETKVPMGNDEVSLTRAWANIGDGICRQYNNYKTYWGSWNNDYRGGNSRLNYINDMSMVKEAKWGGASRDNSYTSGLRTAKNFSEVRDRMSKQIQNRIDHNALDGESSKILSNSKLTPLDDKTPHDIVYVVGTNICELGARYSNRYKYSSHAIIFYDFALEPVIDDNLEYITDLSGCKTLEEALATNKVSLKESDKVVYADNDNVNITKMSKTSGTSYTNSMSTTISNSETISFGQSLSIAAKGGLELPFLAEGKLGVTMGFTWGEAYTSAQSKGETFTETSSDQQSVSVDVPPQSSLGVREQTEDINCTYGFKTPMRVTYKVCLADIVGQVYADDGVVCNFKSYNQGSFASFFGEGGNNGENATDSLYLRAEKNIDKKSYDDFYGKVYTYVRDGDKELKDEGINWAEMTDNGKNAVKGLIHNQPMISNGGMIHVTSQGTKYTVDEPIPLYKLDTVIVNKTKKDFDQEVNVSEGDSYVINNRIKLDAYNRNGVIYTKFLQGEGYWVACDENGNEIPAENNDLFEITSTNILKAKKAGSGFITYRLTDKAKNIYISKEGGQTVNPGDERGGNDVVLSSPIVTVNIK